jgi:hypothetical protein
MAKNMTNFSPSPDFAQQFDWQDPLDAHREGSSSLDL